MSMEIETPKFCWLSNSQSDMKDLQQENYTEFLHLMCSDRWIIKAYQVHGLKCYSW